MTERAFFGNVGHAGFVETECELFVRTLVLRVFFFSLYFS